MPPEAAIAESQPQQAAPPTPSLPDASKIAPDPKSRTATPWEADFDSKLGDDGPAKPAPRQQPPQAAQKPAEEPAKVETPKAEETPAEPKPEAKAEDSEKMPEFKTSRELRKWAEGRDKEARELRAKIKEYEAKKAELEANPKVDETGPLAEKAAKLEAALQEKEFALRMVDYKRSDEYQNQYYKPWLQAQQEAYSEIKELPAIVKDPDTGEEKFRAATEDDFDFVYQQPTIGLAMQAAKERFGADFAAMVMQHRKNVYDKAKAAVLAENSYKEKAAEFEKQRIAKSAEERQQIQAKQKIVAEKVSKEYEAILKIDPADKDASKVLAESREWVDKVFNQNKTMTVEQRLEAGEHIKHKVTAYPLLKAQLEKANAALAEKQKQIDEMRSSGPGKPKAVGEPPVKKRGSWEEDFPE